MPERTEPTTTAAATGRSRASPEPAPPLAAYRLLTRRELRLLVPYTSQHVLRLEKRGLFPRRIQVGPNRVAWLLAEVEAWIAARLEQRRGPPD